MLQRVRPASADTRCLFAHRQWRRPTAGRPPASVAAPLGRPRPRGGRAAAPARGRRAARGDLARRRPAAAATSSR